MPSVAHVDIDLDFEPVDRTASVNGTYTFVNHRDYSYADALYDLRLGALYSLFVPVRVMDLAKDGQGTRSARLLDATAQRQFASALELDAGQILPSDR